MKLNKQIATVLSSVFLLGALSACGSTTDTGSAPTTGSKVESPTDTGTHVEELKLSTVLTRQIIDGKLTYKFSLRNDQDEEVNVKFSSTQRFDYVIKDNNNQVVYTYSADKMFGEMMTEKTLKKGEFFDSEIDLSEAVPQLDEGEYTVEVVSSALGGEKLKESFPVIIGKAEETKVEMLEETVTFNGLQDGNSIEVLNDAGDIEAMRLSESVKEFFNELAEKQNLDTPDKVHIKLYLANGQKNIVGAEKIAK
ncbi:BsuPI-related putative proteinase inhibitor [Bacillus sp. 31A1R]|uniref:Intracellular proteinase inhibitor BsuPI domain-containing protein n=1 Tax=Robertmurraya mangrovi TaxID=3098077 RepID=A0ABU5IXJ0_9BACI|nr:BsuPI-related putative proteinase inhibitor [Bacillus sp. 31A1R]MDZ5471864.1 BsuPI-related putative proteinase inhibitor [Bacillus sp. 31A1R]